MKNYEIINEAITMAENLLASTKHNYEQCLAHSELEIKYQICDYIYNQLKITNFPTTSKIICSTINPPIESYEVTFSSASYIYKGTNYQYQLFIQDYRSGEISRIYFNTHEYQETSDHPIQEHTLIALIKVWDNFKTKFSATIDQAYQARINHIKREANIIKRKQEILTSFKL